MTAGLHSKKMVKRVNDLCFADAFGPRKVYPEPTAKTRKTHPQPARHLPRLHVLAALVILCTCAFESFAQDCIAVRPAVIKYNVCDLPYAGDTLIYYSGFEVVKDGPWEHMKVYDYVLPRNLTGTLRLNVKGGKGGDARINCGVELYGDGGRGAMVTGTIRVGDGGIPRGSTVRYVLGEAGEDSYSEATGAQYDRGGSGGGASAILFREPDSTNWKMLMIAGGGGGGYASCFPHDENGVASLYRLARTGGSGGLEQSWLGGGGAGFYVWENLSNHNKYYVSCDGYVFTADEFWHTSFGWAIHATVTDYDAQNFCDKISGGGGWGSRGKAPCGPCSGGMAGNEWLGPNLPNVYNANYIGGSCVTYSNMRQGGRGFCGGGAAYSRSTWYFGSRHDWQPGCGGGGGATGGAGAVGGPNGLTQSGTKPAEGGTSWVNEQYVTNYSFVADSRVKNGYGYFKFLPDSSSVLPALSIGTGEPAPFCTGTQVTMVATLAARPGSLVDGIVNPVFTWQRNGQSLGTGTNVGYNIFTRVDNPQLYTFNTISLTYNPGDVITCSVSAIDTNLCGRPVQVSTSMQFAPDNGRAGSLVQVTPLLGTTLNGENSLCQEYYDYAFDKGFGKTSLNATARFLESIAINHAVPYHPTYKWYINGDRISLRYNINDSVASSPSIYVADGDSVWCEVTSEHCNIPSISNVIHFNVTTRPSTGGTIRGPQQPCTNTNVTYAVKGALNAVSYTWVIEGDASNISSGDSSSCSFTTGTGDVQITCYTHGSCGRGDTLHFTVTPSNHVTTTCYTQPIIVSPSVHCAGEPVTLYLLGDTDDDNPKYDCYQWSNGATTRSITVTADGSYYVYVNGCRSEAVQVTGIATVQPSVTIGIVPRTQIDNLRNYWCRQDGYRRINVSSSSDLSSFTDLVYRWYKNGVLISGTSPFGPDNLDLYLNNNTYFKSGDIITCKLIASTSCGTVTTWSNAVTLPDINDPAVPSVTVTPSTTTVCSGVGVNFTAVAANIGTASSYGWFVDGNLAGSGSPQFSVSFVNNTSGPQTHAVYGTALGDGTGVLCSTSGPNARSETIFITVLPQPAVVATAMNVTGCAGTPVTLSGSPAGGVFSKPNPYIGPSTTYTYSYVDQNGCASTSAPATIALTPLPIAEGVVNPADQALHRTGVLVYPSDTVCAGQPVTLTAFGGASYAWSGGIINGEPFTVNESDSFTLTTFGSNDCSGDRVFVKIATGFSHSLGIKADGTLWTWGANTYGTLGNGTNSNSTTPVQVGTATDWVNISAGEYHSLAIKSNGTLWAWGRNFYGTLGIGTNTNSNVPVQVGTDTDWKEISAGGEFSIAIKSNGTMWGWGYNADKEIGTSFDSNPNTPRRIGSDNDWSSIATGYTHSLALKRNGTLWSWGTSASGALGNGNATVVFGPVQSGVESNWISIAAGALHSLGIKADGTLWTWGFNTYGGLGDGTTTSRNAPVQVEPGSQWMSVSGGLYHSAGIKADGSLWAWGNNSYGQLGTGTYDAVIATPTQIGGEQAWVAISAGGYHTAGFKSYGTSLAWGRNTSGQLGDGTTIAVKAFPSSIPTPPATIKVGITVKQAPDLAISVSPATVVCAGAPITLTATGTDVLTWSDGITNGVSFIPSASNTYTVSSTGANGCTATLAQPIMVNPPSLWYLDADDDGHYVSGPVSSCTSPGAGYNTTATDSGDCDDNDGNKWQSSSLYVDADGDGYTNGTASVCYGDVAPSGYSITSLGADCNDNNSNVHAPITAVVTNNSGTTVLTCTVPSISVTASGGSAYSWSDGASVVGTSADLIVNVPGTYTVTVAAAGGCPATQTVVITQNKAVPVTSTASSNSPVCAGATLNLSAMAVDGATYHWTGPNSFSSGLQNPVLTNVTSAAAGIYSVIAISTANGCQSSAGTTTVSVTASTAPTVTTSGSTTFCQGGSVTLTAQKGFKSYRWSNGATSQSITVTAGGSYTVTVTNTNGCPATSLPVVVTVNPIPAPFTVTGGGSYCSGGVGVPIGLNGSQTGVTYQLFRGAAALLPTVSGTGYAVSFGAQTVAGTYTVKATGAGGCSATMSGSKAVSIAAGPTVSIADAKAYRYGVAANTVYNGWSPASTLTLSAGVSGGTSPYSYLWKRGTTAVGSASLLTVNSAGTYSVTVTDGKSCSSTASKTIVVVYVGCDGGGVNVCQAGKKTSPVNKCLLASQVDAALKAGAILGACGGVLTSTGVSSDLAWLSDNAALERSVQLSPNPANGSVQLTLKGYTGKVSLRLTDAQGRIVWQRQVQPTGAPFIQELDVAGFTAGLYLLTAVDEKGNRQAGRLVIAR